MRKINIDASSGSRKAFIFYFILSVLLLILPLKGFVSSVKAVLSYVFIPQIRAAHSSVEYFANVSSTVRELLAIHKQKTSYEEDLKETLLIKEEARVILEENERLSEAMLLNPEKRWNGVWAKTAYRDPSRWTSIIIDKGTNDGVSVKSAVIGFDGTKIGLVGTVIEEELNTSKVLLLNDEEFSAAAHLEGTSEDGLITGSKSGMLKLRYVPLGTEILEDELVYTSKSSVIFPEGISIGKVISAEKGEEIKTSLTLNVRPIVRPGAVKEVFVITGIKAGKK
ncbi:rod shape-determining protein MreC [Elusimicrobium simillimum]|uniref:rod shape-determining protein MreC n=1 Tax=Elusimicrobium simillimum TaxID=3143438 RepID=UPI003C6EDE0C